MKKLVAGLVLVVVVFSGVAVAGDSDNAILMAVVLGYQRAVMGESLLDVVHELEERDIQCSGIKCVEIAVAIQGVMDMQQRREERGLEW